MSYKNRSNAWIVQLVNTNLDKTNDKEEDKTLTQLTSVSYSESL